MRTIPFMRTVLAGALSMALAATASAQVVVAISVGGPPELPVYEQPPCPAAGYLWTPGYWAYDPDNGYYWVPGTWVLVPQAGLLWTPGYWGWNDNGYVWNAGYWAPEVGFYGGINYGYGYGGAGYQGGYWNNGALYYNRSVNHFSNTTTITNVYNKTVVNNTTVTNVSYNGGTGGTSARPTPAELAVVHARHVPPTAEQTQHEHTAAGNRDQWASTNHGKPAVVATAKPGVFTGQGVVKTSQVSHTYRAVATGEVANKSGTPPSNAAHPKAAALAPTKAAPPPAAKPKVEEHPKAVDQSKATQFKAKPPPRKPDEQPKAEARPKSSPPPEQGKEPAPDRKPKADSGHS